MDLSSVSVPARLDLTRRPYSGLEDRLDTNIVSIYDKKFLHW